jgi:AAA+ ATPase superfamily predicted ATPase
MRIEEVTEEAIIFDNGNKITYNHPQDCCEWNYADFSILTPNTINYNYDFDENLQFQSVEEMGFKFGSDGHWIFIPCYSEQNGYYSDDIDIYYFRKNHFHTDHVLNFIAKFVDV